MSKINRIPGVLCFCFTLTVLFFFSTTLRAQEGSEVIRLWPGVAPDEPGDIGEEKILPPGENEGQVIRLTNVTTPELHVFLPRGKDNPFEVEEGPAPSRTGVVIAPGGGYYVLAWDKEGTEVAAMLNKLGVTAFVLRYRVPSRAGRPRHAAALQDAQRAMSLVRSRAAEWDLDPDRIGMLWLLRRRQPERSHGALASDANLRPDRRRRSD